MEGMVTGVSALLAGVAAYAAVREPALRRRLRRERVRAEELAARVAEFDLLLRATQALNASLELDAVLEIILRAACDLVAAPQGSVQLVPTDNPGELEIVAVHGSGSAVRGQRQGVGEGYSGRSAMGRRPIELLGPQPESRQPHMGASLVLPLAHRNELVGVLNIAAPEREQGFSEAERRSLSLFAETASAAISNARLHHATQESVQALTELDRMKDDFLAQVTHELRTPLTSVIGLAQTIQRGTGRLVSERLTELAGLIVHEGWRLDRLVDELLRTSQAQRGAPALVAGRVDAVGLAGSVMAGLREGAPAHVLTLRVPEEPIERVVDADALSRILVNLVGNAVKYTPAGTQVIVGLRAEDPDELVLTVDDDGPGIPESMWDAIFEKFRRGEGLSSGGGMGLGLFLVRALAEAHGGEATLTRSDLGGCRFTVHLQNLPAAISATVQ
jgi:two-component system sensor histidine kinase KdpD